MTHHVKDQLNELPVGTWRFDPARTTISVTATKLGFFSIPATLALTDGSVEIGSDHQVTTIEVTAAADSYTSKNAKRNEHIRGADFLDAERHPVIQFRADSVTGTADGYRVDGTVTVKGDTSPLRVEVTDVEISSDRGSFRATATVDRAAVGVDKLPSLIIGRQLQLSVAASLIAADR